MPNLLLTMWDTIKSSNIGILVAAGLGMFAVIGGLSMLSYHYTLSGIKSRTISQLRFMLCLLFFRHPPQQLPATVIRYPRPALALPEKTADLRVAQFTERPQGKHLAVGLRQIVQQPEN